MSLSDNSLRIRALNYVRRQIAAGKAAEADLKRWEAELGPEVREIAKAHAPPKPAKSASKE